MICVYFCTNVISINQTIIKDKSYVDIGFNILDWSFIGKKMTFGFCPGKKSTLESSLFIQITIFILLKSVLSVDTEDSNWLLVQKD